MDESVGEWMNEILPALLPDCAGPRPAQLQKHAGSSSRVNQAACEEPSHTCSGIQGELCCSHWGCLEGEAVYPGVPMDPELRLLSLSILHASSSQPFSVWLHACFSFLNVFQSPAWTGACLEFLPAFLGSSPCLAPPSSFFQGLNLLLHNLSCWLSPLGPHCPCPLCSMLDPPDTNTAAQVCHIPAGLGTGTDCHPLPAKSGNQDTSLLPYLWSSYSPFVSDSLRH